MTRPAASLAFSTLFQCLCAGVLMLVPVRAASAQNDSQPPPAHISVVEGSAELEREGRTEAAPASMPVIAGDRLRTRAGRVEVLFADGSTLHLDNNTLVDFQSDDVIRLLDGRLRLNISGPDRRVGYRIDVPSAWVRIDSPGEYRVSIQGARGAEVELAVLRGSAELVNEDGSTALRAGERAYASVGSAPSIAYVLNSAAWDDFDRWSEARRDERLGVSAQYLPEDLRYESGTLDQYGAWSYQPVYGYVWYPRVNVGWRPYYHGRWRHVTPYGWTWIGYDPWAWTTHHYGRWGFSAGNWFWIPGRIWGPAWVSWGYAPGYVSWCPLGFNNRAVFSFGVNYFGGHRYNPWYGWTVVPHRSFGTGHVNVGINVVNVNHLDTRVRESFSPRERPPEFQHFAVPRGTASAPIRVAGTGSVAVAPRQSTVAGAAQPRTQRTDAFRSRSSSGGQLTGPGLPAPSREPRSVAPSIRSVPRQSPPQATERSAPSVTTPATPGTERRAVPRRYEPSGPQVPSTAVTQPPVERYRDPSAGPSSMPERYRVSPRREDPSAGPSPSAPDREGIPSGREPYAVPRAVPRSADPGPPAGYRSNPGVERRAPAESRPAGPPPSAEPSRPSGPPPGAVGSAPRGGGGGGREGGSVGAPAGRSRGGQPATGSAVRGRGQ
jgi:uncharacterized protein DUF6600/FecR-like protein